MAKPNFTLPNKPAIKSGSILSYNYTDDFTFVPAPLTFNRDSAATRVNEKGLIEDVGYFGPDLVQNGDFSEIGPELLVNGDFSDGLNGWTTHLGNPTVSNGVVHFTGDLIKQLILTIGKTYKVTVNVTEVNSGLGKVQLGGTIVLFNGLVGEQTFYATATSNIDFYIGRNLSTDDFKIDNVSVKEVGQNWEFGAGWSVDQASSKAVYSDGAKFSQLKQQLINNSTSTYQLSFDTVVNAGQFRIKFGSNNYNIVSQSGSYKVNGVFSTTNTFITFEDYDDISSDFSITNVSVIEVLGDKPRIDYSDSLTEPSLLLEPQSTNLVTYSEDFTKWVKEATVTLTSNYGISPDGTQNSTRVQMDINDSVYISATSGNNFSIYVKGVQDETIRISNGGALTHTLTGEWDRISLYDTGNSSSLISINTYSVTTARDIEIWGAQLEALSYATSYIPTSGSTATRLGETANNAGDVNVFNSEEGVLYAEIKPLSNDVLSSQRSIQLEGLNGSSDNEIIIQYLNNTLRFLLYGNSVLQLQRQETVSLSSYIKVALLYKNNAFKIYINGTERYTVSGSYTMPIGLNKINFDRSGVSNFEGKVKNLKVFNKALTDRELEILTIQ